MRRSHRILLWMAATLGWVAWHPTALAQEPVSPVEAPASASPSDPPWCAPELEVLANEVCAFVPENLPADSPRTLVIYLHGVIQPGTTWQHGPEKGMVRAAKVHGFSVITPRGRRGIGPGSMRDWWTWPTSARAQSQVEQDVIDEWMYAKTILEHRAGTPFDKVYVIGFSNGAYYASSLALRGRLSVDGYAMIAGGSAHSWARRSAAQVTHRPPIYVGYGHRDTVGKDCRELGSALQSLGWRHRIVGRPRVGHLITDSQIREAMDLFRSKP